VSTITRARAPASRLVSESVDTSETLYRMTVGEYERLGELLNDKRVELIDGLLVVKMTKKPPHVVACELTRAAIDGIAPAGWHTRAGDPVKIPRYNEPEPDVTLVRGALRDYTNRHPGPRDVAIVAEIADSSLAKDRRRVRVYGGRRGIPVYWIVNLVDRRIEVYSEPRTAGYRTRVDYAAGESVPVVLDGVHVGSIAVDDMLP
jgi:Uma2 family endonuclease